MNKIIDDGQLTELDIKLVDTANLQYPKNLKGIPTHLNNNEDLIEKQKITEQLVKLQMHPEKQDDYLSQGSYVPPRNALPPPPPPKQETVKCNKCGVDMGILNPSFSPFSYYCNKCLSGNKEQKDEREKRQFNTGAVRDVEIGKEDFTEGISWLALKRFAQYMDSKAVRYGRGNWRKGIPPESYVKSLARHLQKFLVEWEDGICEEHDDHLSAMVFNLFGIMHELELHKYGKGRFEINKNYSDLYPITPVCVKLSRDVK